MRRTPYAATPTPSTAAPAATEESGSANARTTQPISPTSGIRRRGRPSSSPRVKAEALAIA
ncbi:Uncharacterised protein [Mycobacterium tuberculosis]|nr:Uncharacterised protein [Mycobacterium tuberculosis]